MLSIGRSLSKPPPEYIYKISGSALISGNEGIQLTDSGGWVGSDFDVGSYTNKDYSASFWWKRLDDDTGSSNQDGYKWFEMGNYNNGGVEFYYDDSTGDDERIKIWHRGNPSGGEVQNCTKDLDHNVWYHFCITYDASATTSTIYISSAGTFDSSPAVDTGLSLPDPMASSITKVSVFAPDADSNCYVAEFAWWKDRVLTASEAEQLYNSGNGKAADDFPTGLVGYWKINQNDTASKVIDYVGNHDAVATGLVFGTDTP